MPHVDDGHLHAYLDGQLDAVAGHEAAAIEAHIAACAECRARLDQARAYADRSTSILAASGPRDLEVPPFESILAGALGGRTGPSAPPDSAAEPRVPVAERTDAGGSSVTSTETRVPGGGPSAPLAGSRIHGPRGGPSGSSAGSGPRRRMRPWTASAWAATIALALAMGWYARDALFHPVERQLAGDMDLPASTAESGPVGPVPSPAPQPDAAPARSTAGAPRAPEGGALGARAEIQALEAPAAAPGPTAPRLADAARDSGAPGGVARAGDTITAETLVPTGVTVTRMAERAAARRDVAADAVAPTVAPPAARSAIAAEAPPSLDAAPEPAWAPIDRAEAERRLGGPLALVPGLELVSVAGATVDGAFIVRAVQRLDDGHEFELRQRRAVEADMPVERAVVLGETAAPPRVDASRESDADAVTTLTIVRDGYVILGRAALPADSLRALLVRIR